MIYAHFFVANTINAHFVVAKMIWANFFVAKTIYALFLSLKEFAHTFFVAKMIYVLFLSRKRFTRFFLSRKQFTHSARKVFARWKLPSGKLRLFGPLGTPVLLSKASGSGKFTRLCLVQYKCRESITTTSRHGKGLCPKPLELWQAHTYEWSAGRS